MNNDKCWTYGEITGETEAILSSIRDQATRTAGSEEAHATPAIALGVYYLWFSLTKGFRVPGDDERLYELASITTTKDN